MRSLAADGLDIADNNIKADSLAAIGAADDWVDQNQTAYNAALPEPFRTWATPRQKAMLLTFIVQERFTAEIE
jgi:hypothetical protein